MFSRHQYVFLTHRQDLDALIAGIEEAWERFGGVTRRLIIDNMKAAVVKADRYEPVFNRTFQDYSQHRGFIIDPPRSNTSFSSTMPIKSTINSTKDALFTGLASVSAFREESAQSTRT